MAGPISAISNAEWKLLARNAAVPLTATVTPLAVSVLFVITGNGRAGWGFPVAVMMISMFAMTAYMTSAGSLSYRRDELYLKRLRCAESSDSQVLLGVLSPVIVGTLVQCLLMLIVVGIAGPAIPGNPLLLVLVLALGTSMSVLLGMATTGITASAEQAQTAATPVVLLLLGSAVWAGMSTADQLNPIQLALPGGAVVDLMRLSYEAGGSFGSQLLAALPALGVLLAWTLVSAVAAHRLFRWEPRR